MTSTPRVRRHPKLQAMAIVAIGVIGAAIESRPASAVGIRTQVADVENLTIAREVRANEGNSGLTQFGFQVTLSSPAEGDESVSFTVPHISYDSEYGNLRIPPDPEGSDTAISVGRVRFNAGETTRVVNIGVVGDTIPEPDETFFVDIFEPVGVRLSPDNRTRVSTHGVIVDDDANRPFPKVLLSETSIIEGNAGTRIANVTIKLDAPAVGRPSLVAFTRSLVVTRVNDRAVSGWGDASCCGRDH
jgi:hypothetical protein